MKYVEDRWEFDGHNRILAIALGLSPIWFLVFAAITASHFGGGLYQPTEAEVQARERVQLLVLGLGGLLMVAGTIALWRARSIRAAVGATFLLTLPSLIVLLLGPAFVLVLWNLGR